jgi:hypothetical protein
LDMKLPKRRMTAIESRAELLKVLAKYPSLRKPAVVLPSPGTTKELVRNGRSQAKFSDKVIEGECWRGTYNGRKRLNADPLDLAHAEIVITPIV